MKIEEVGRDTLYLCVETPEGLFRFGTLSLVVESNGRTIYEFDLDEDKFNKAMELSGDNLFPGFDPRFGMKQRHDKEIYFIYERTFHPRRPDLEEILKPWGMRPEEYNKWEFIKRTKGLHYRDKWRVTTDIAETY